MSVHLSQTSRSEHMDEGSTSVRESDKQARGAATDHSVQRQPPFKSIAIIASIATAALAVLGGLAGGIALIAAGVSIASIAIGATLIVASSVLAFPLVVMILFIAKVIH